MLILFAIFLLLITSCLMFGLRLFRPRFGIQGFLAILATLIGWVLVLMSYSDIPQTLTLLSWEPDSFFPNPPNLIIDDTSWYFALAIITIALASVVTSIAHLGQSQRSNPSKTEKLVEVIEIHQETGKEILPDEPVVSEGGNKSTSWHSWAGILFLTSMGLLAATAGNLITLLLAWVALDLFELIIRFIQEQSSKTRERIIIAFSIRMAGVALVVLACIITWSQSGSLSFNAINLSTSTYLLLAVILRLGSSLLLLSPDPHYLQKREFTLSLGMVSAAASYILLVRVSETSFLGILGLILLIISALAGMYSSIRWFTAGSEFNGRAYWLFATACLAIASAILNRPSATIVWCIASLLSGVLIFSMTIRHRNLIPIIVLGTFGFSALPFSPTWMGTDLYRFTGSPSNPLNPPFYYILLFFYLLVQSLLLAGIFRFFLKAIIIEDGRSKVHIERWVWFIYPLGLIIILLAHFLIGILIYPNLDEIPLTGWVVGVISVCIAGMIWYLSRGYINSLGFTDQPAKFLLMGRSINLEGNYRIIRSLFRSVTRLTSLISVILEGDGGILWAIVLFALIFVFLRR